MKKHINYKKTKYQKNINIFIVILLFLLFLSSSIFLIERDYSFLEKVLKTSYNKLNAYIISNSYNTNYTYDYTQNEKMNYLKKENDELRRILNLKSKNEKYNISYVTNHKIKDWFNKIEISSNGYEVSLKDAVVNQNGLIGFVDKVYKDTCEVDLITNVSLKNMRSVQIVTDNKNISGILKKYDKNTKLFIVMDVIDNSDIKIGDKVVLSGYEKESYKGLLIGSVVKQKVSNYGLNKTIWVKSDVNFDDLLFVAIVGES